jgi:iron complex transport system substrate-binding protein
MKTFFILLLSFFTQYSPVNAAEAGATPRRIVSLAPSTTEILFALGLGDNIVGDTTFCDYPEEAKKKPKIGGMSNPSLEAIVTMKPDLVVMTTDGNPKEIEERLRSLHIRTYVFTARRLLELPQGIREMGDAMGVQARAESLAHEIETGINDVKTKQSAMVRLTLTIMSNSRMIRNPQLAMKKVLFIVWPEPLIVAGPGTVMDDAIGLLGYENIAVSAKTPYPKYSIEEVIRQSPDVIFVGKASGMDIRDISQKILKRLAPVPAVKNNAVCYISDNLYRLGPRVIKGIEELAACER